MVVDQSLQSPPSLNFYSFSLSLSLQEMSKLFIGLLIHVQHNEGRVNQGQIAKDSYKEHVQL